MTRLSEAQALQPETPSTLQAELRDYQQEVFRWLARLAHWGAGACLADDMGLGKTIQALALILIRAATGPTLILAPTSVCMNWLSEAARFAPTLKTRRFGPGDRQQMLDQASPLDLVVCSYGLLQSESERLAGVTWSTVAADEAQAIKNSLTKRSKAAKPTSRSSRRRLGSGSVSWYLEPLVFAIVCLWSVAVRLPRVDESSSLFGGKLMSLVIADMAIRHGDSGISVDYTCLEYSGKQIYP